MPYTYKTQCSVFLISVAFSMAAFLEAADPPMSLEESGMQTRQARKHMKSFELRQETKEKPPKRETIIELIDRPLLTYGEPTRMNETGTVWAFGREGRPVAFVELFRAPAKDGRSAEWRQALTLTSLERPIMTTPIETRWTPET